MPPLNSGNIEYSNDHKKQQYKESSSSDSTIDIKEEKHRHTEKDENTTNSFESVEVKKEIEKETKQEEVLDVDDYLTKIGEFGKAQKIILLLVYLMYIPHCYHTISTYFTGQSPAWKCKGLNGECNMTGAFDVGDAFYERRCSMNRSSWEYVESKSYSIVTEWDLVCEKKEYPFISSSIFWSAWAIGALVFGWATNRYGRKNVYFISWTMMIFAKFCCGISTHFWMFTAFEFVAGFAQGGVALVASVIVSELVGPSYKSMAGAGLSLVYTLAACVMAMQGWLLLNWRHFLMITTAPYLILLMSYRIIPESFRWLRIKQRLNEAEDVLQNICSTNGKELPMTKLKPAMESNVKSSSILDILKFKPLFMAVVIQCMIWFINGQVFIGTAMAADQLGGSIYRDFILVNLVGLPAAYVCMVALNRFGRKPTLMISLGTTCLSFVVVTLIHPKSDYVWGRIGSGMFGQLCMTVAFFGMYTWSLEILPTEIRSQYMGITSLMARLGACSAPWVAQWLEHVHHTLSFAIMGGAAFLGVILCAQLPETRGKPTAETLKDTIQRDTKVTEEKNKDEIKNENFYCV